MSKLIYLTTLSLLKEVLRNLALLKQMWLWSFKESKSDSLSLPQMFEAVGFFFVIVVVLSNSHTAPTNQSLLRANLCPINLQSTDSLAFESKHLTKWLNIDLFSFTPWPLLNSPLKAKTLDIRFRIWLLDTWL